MCLAAPCHMRSAPPAKGTEQMTFSPFKTALLGVLCISTLPGQATANPGPIAEIICAATDDMQFRLEQDFRSVRVWQGIRSSDQRMELWEDGRGDWTLVISYAKGTACIVAMGSKVFGFEDLHQG